MPGGMAGARPEPPEEGTKPGPARVACPCSWKRSLGTENARDSGERGKQIPGSCPSLPGCAEGTGTFPPIPVGMALAGTHWEGCRTWTRPPVTRDKVEICCSRPRCFSRATLEQNLVAPG